MGTALIAFMYEVGAATWFGIPVALIHLTWTNTALALAALAGLLHLLFAMGYIVSGWQGRGRVISPKRIMLWVPFLCGSAIVTWQHGLGSRFALVCAGILIVVVALDLMGEWLNRAAERRGVRLEDEDSHPLRSPLNRVAISGFWATAALGVAFSTGHAHSQGRTTFLTTEEARPRVLLRSYGSTLVLAPLEEGRGEFGPAIQFVPVGGDPRLSYVWRSLGRLTRAEGGS